MTSKSLLFLEESGVSESYGLVYLDWLTVCFPNVYH
jgi:hypothetical protein